MTTTAGQSGTEAPAGLRLVEVSREPVELYKILKFEGMVSSGGEAKVAIASGQVLVNGKTETQKRKKILSGDTIEFNNDKIRIKLSSPMSATPVPAKEEEGPHKSGPAEALGSEKE